MRAPDTDTVFEAVRQWGAHSLAYSALQDGMEYFGDSDTGWIAYRRALGQCVVLADPIAPPERHADLIASLVAAHPRCMFMQASEATCAELRQHGFHSTPVGFENEIDTELFTLRGKRKGDVRHYRNKAEEGGVAVAEEQDTPALRAELRPVSDAWLPGKSWWERELEFLARPYVSRPEPDVRIFTGRIDGRVVGFVILDPIYADAQPRGYTVTILRNTPAAPEGTVDYINLAVVEALRAEGIPLLSLGVSPFDAMESLADEHGRGLPAVYASFLFMRRFGTPIYHFRGLSFHKSRYRARRVPVFAAVRGPLGVWPLIASARVTRMI